jgi:hypothetical protein
MFMSESVLSTANNNSRVAANSSVARVHESVLRSAFSRVRFARLQPLDDLLDCIGLMLLH